jgi:hypothetical protein
MLGDGDNVGTGDLCNSDTLLVCGIKIDVVGPDTS